MRYFAPSMLEAPLANDIQSTGYLRPSHQQGHTPYHEMFAHIIFCQLDSPLFTSPVVVGGAHLVPAIANSTTSTSIISTPIIELSCYPITLDPVDINTLQGMHR